MTAEQLEELQYLLKNALPDWCVYSEPEVGLNPGLFSGTPGTPDFQPVEPLMFHELHLAALAPSLARRVIAAEKLVEALENVPLGDGPIAQLVTAYREASK